MTTASYIGSSKDESPHDTVEMEVESESFDFPENGGSAQGEVLFSSPCEKEDYDEEELSNASLPIEDSDKHDDSLAHDNNSAADTTNTAKLDIFWDFNGSISFVFGSPGFIISLHQSNNWLPYFRYGCIIWIWGCISYSIPIVHKFFCGRQRLEGRVTNTHLSLADAGCLLCMLLFIIGCILGGFFKDEGQVQDHMLAISYLFCLGSFALAIEPLYTFYCFIKVRMCTNRLHPNNSNEKRGWIRFQVSSDRIVECLAIASFCVAGFFGGFGSTDLAVMVGIYHWGIDSLVCFMRSCLLLYNRNQSEVV